MKIALPDLDAPESAVSNHELRRFLAGELTPERRAHIESDASLAPRLERLAAEQRAEDAAFALEVPLPRFLADHETRTAKPASLLSRLLSMRFTVGASALVATAAAVFFVVRTPDEVLPHDGIKGDARVGFLVREANGVRFGVDGEQLGPGDQIQFNVKDDAKHGAMVLVGIDGRGAVTIYASETVSERPKGITQEKTRLLPDSVVLDDATGAERFFVVYGDPPIETLRAEVEAAAQELAKSGVPLSAVDKLPLRKRHTQSSVHIVKVPTG